MKEVDQLHPHISANHRSEGLPEHALLRKEALSLDPTLKEFLDRAIIPALVRDFLHRQRVLEDALAPVAKSGREGSP